MMNRLAFGQTNEKKAAAFLKKQGHKIIVCNFHAKHGEIDIISVVGRKKLVFTEVRSKNSITYGHPAETIDFNKQQRIRETAKVFIYKNPMYENYECRFDVITIIGEGKSALLEYFEDAF